MSSSSKKTWSRETAVILLLVLCYTIYRENVELTNVIIWPITTYASVAFGLRRIDVSDKLFQTKSSEPPNR